MGNNISWKLCWKGLSCCQIPCLHTSNPYRGSSASQERGSTGEGSTRIEITAEERKVCDTLHSASKVRFMDMASLHLGRDTENQPRRAKVQNNKSQVSLVSPRAELKEYTALVFWDQALQLEKLQLFFSLEGLQIRQLCHILLLPLGHLTGFKKKVLQSQNYFALICILHI